MGGEHDNMAFGALVHFLASLIPTYKKPCCQGRHHHHHHHARNSSSSSSSPSSSSSSSTSSSSPSSSPPPHHYFKSAKKLKSIVCNAIMAKGKVRELATTFPPHEVQTQLIIKALEEVKPPSPICIRDEKYQCSQQVEFHNDYYSSLNEEDFKTVVDDFIQRFNKHIAQEQHTIISYS